MAAVSGPTGSMIFPPYPEAIPYVRGEENPDKATSGALPTMAVKAFVAIPAGLIGLALLIINAIAVRGGLSMLTACACNCALVPFASAFIYIIFTEFNRLLFREGVNESQRECAQRALITAYVVLRTLATIAVSALGILGILPTQVVMWVNMGLVLADIALVGSGATFMGSTACKQTN